MKEKSVHLPSRLNIDENDLPELKDWKVGEFYTFTVKAKLTSLRANDPMLVSQGDNDAEKLHGDFEIEEVKCGEGQDKYDKGESQEEKEHRKVIMKKVIDRYKNK